MFSDHFVQLVSLLLTSHAVAVMAADKIDPCSKLRDSDSQQALDMANEYCKGVLNRFCRHPISARVRSSFGNAGCTRVARQSDETGFQCTVQVAGLMSRYRRSSPHRALLSDYVADPTFWRPRISFEEIRKPDTENSKKVDRYSKWFEGSEEWDSVAVYNTKGPRLYMEDNYDISSNARDTGGASFFGIYDGHVGAEASLLARRNLLKNLANEVAALKKFTMGTRSSNSGSDSKTSSPIILESFSSNAESSRPERKTAQDESKKITRGLGWLKSKYEDARLRNYLTSEGSINYEKLLFSVILSEDKNVRKVTRAHGDWSGTTALVAVIEGSQLIVANVGDSRGVMCDSKGDAVPLSFDHKPDRKEEKTRITRMFGRVEKDEYGTYRVDGSLAVSRTLGDRWAKGFNRVIATPEIFTFDLSDYKPQFLVLATDGLYDELSSAEVVAFVKEKLTEPYFGARDLVRLAYQLGSEDNITVLVINFNGGRFGPRNYKPAADQQTIGTRAAVKTRWVDRVPFLKNVFGGRKGFRKSPSSKKSSNSSLSVEYI